MRYAVEGEMDGRRVRIVWSNGRLQGTAEAVRAVKHMAKLLNGSTIKATPTGPFYYSNFLNNPLAALCVIRQVIEIDTMRGEIPTAPYEPGVIYSPAPEMDLIVLPPYSSIKNSI